MKKDRQPLLEQLLELRKRFLYSMAVVLLLFLCLIGFANSIYEWVAFPLRQMLPPDAHMIATEVASPFLAPFKLTFIVAIFISLPYLMYQAWSFIAPGLYKHEKKRAFFLLILSFLLFCLGVGFAYFVVLPVLFRFFIQASPATIVIMTDINQYLDFVLVLFFTFGFAFEIPIVIFTLISTGVTSVEKLKEKRGYVIIACFFLGMIFTPPDVFSQTMLALPMWFLFEIGLILAMFHKKKHR